MGKDPAFLFYPGDWLGGTTTFTRSHKGAYMDLLMAQFSQWSLPLDDVRFVLGNDFDLMWESKLKSKFKQDSDGSFYNQKLRDEVVRRKLFTVSRNENLKKSPSHMVSHMQNHMENGNGNEDVNIKYKGRRFIRPTLEQVKDYCKETGSKVDPEIFFHNYESTDWIKANGQKVKNWKSTLKTWEKRNLAKEEVMPKTQDPKKRYEETQKYLKDLEKGFVDE